MLSRELNNVILKSAEKIPLSYDFKSKLRIEKCEYFTNARCI